MAVMQLSIAHPGCPRHCRAPWQPRTKAPCVKSSTWVTVRVTLGARLASRQHRRPRRTSPAPPRDKNRIPQTRAGEKMAGHGITATIPGQQTSLRICGGKRRNRFILLSVVAYYLLFCHDRAQRRGRTHPPCKIFNRFWLRETLRVQEWHPGGLITSAGHRPGKSGSGEASLRAGCRGRAHFASWRFSGGAVRSRALKGPQRRAEPRRSDRRGPAKKGPRIFTDFADGGDAAQGRDGGAKSLVGTAPSLPPCSRLFLIRAIRVIRVHPRLYPPSRAATSRRHCPLAPKTFWDETSQPHPDPQSLRGRRRLVAVAPQRGRMTAQIESGAAWSRPVLRPSAWSASLRSLPRS
jgi:hypothetical protein